MRVVLANHNYRPPIDPITGRDSSEALALKYLAAYVEPLGHEAHVVDSQFRDLPESQALAEIVGLRPDVIGLSHTDWSLKEGHKWITHFREQLPEVVICAGGPGPSSWYEELFMAAPELDLVVLGEGEATFAELLERLQSGRPWRDIDGIAYLDDNLNIVKNRPRQFISDMDSIPFPRRESKYPLNSATLAGSRGCYALCTFCDIVNYSNGQPGKRLRPRSPENLLDEMEQLYHQQGIRWFNFVDDVFTGIDRFYRGWTDRLVQGMAERGLRDVSLFCESRVNDVDEEKLLKLKAAGLKTIAFGIETASRRALKLFDKKTTHDQNVAAIRLVQRLNIHYELFSMLVEADTTPREMWDDIEQFVAWNYLQQNDPVPFSVQVIAFRSYAFRGTGIYQSYKDRGLVKEDNFSVSYALQDPGTQRISNACMQLHQRIREPLARFLSFSYVPAIQAGDMVRAIREKRFANLFMQADLKFVRRLIRTIIDEPNAPERVIAGLVEDTVREIREIELAERT